jgi:type II pantothenate kinase
MATKGDLALGILNLVFETVGMVSIFAARSVGVTDIILTGNVTDLPHCRTKFDEFNRLKANYGVDFLIPEKSRFATVIGTALRGLDEYGGAI